MEMFVLRIGNAERESTVDQLTEHHVHGRLDVEELDRRQRAALEATTQAELIALTSDLPALEGGPRQPRRPARPGRSPFRWVVPPAAVAGSAVWFANAHTNAVRRSRRAWSAEPSGTPATGGPPGGGELTPGRG